MSLMPMKKLKSVSALVHGVDLGFEATELRYSFTWSVRERTVGRYGVTSLASMVAPLLDEFIG